MSADEIARWADEPRARSALPALIRRLLYATANPTRLSFPDGASTDRAGYDGEFETVTTGAFWPAGRSVWELSTSRDAIRKMHRDLGKRVETLTVTADPPEYVAVSARRLDQKAKAEFAAADHGRFTAARVLDADDIAAWLSAAPAVAVWFREVLLNQQGAADLFSFDEALEAWAHETEPPLPPRMLLLGRERQALAAELRSWAEAGQPSPIIVTAADPHEAAMFAAACLALDPINYERWLSRGVVVRSREALQLVGRLQDRSELLPILDYAADEPVRQDRRIILARPTATTPPGDRVISLPEVAWSLLAEGLVQQAGMDPGRAEVVARDARGSLQAVRRPLSVVAAPNWARKYNPRVLAALVLVGGYQHGVAAYEHAMQALLGDDARTTPGIIEQLKLEPGSPLIVEQTYRGTHYSFVSHREAWEVLKEHVTGLLSQFEVLALNALTEDDAPQTPIVGGAALALARLAWTPSIERGVSAASYIVRKALEQAPAARWLRLAHHLPLLAEAAPDEYLQAVRIGLETAGGIAELLRIGDRSPIVRVLWGLERLAWKHEYYTQTVDAAAALADADVAKTNVSPTPRSVVSALVDVRVPQTNAPNESVLDAMRELRRRHEATAFRVLCQAGHRGMYLEQHAADVMPVTVREFRERAHDWVPTAHERYRLAIALAIELAGADGTRWVELLGAHLSEDEVLAALERSADQIASGRDELVAKLRGVLHQDAWLAARESGKRWLKDAERKRLCAIYERLLPADKPQRVAWLFRIDAALPETTAPEWREQQTELDDARLKALESISDPDAVFQLLAEVETPGTAGDALRRTSFRKPVEAMLRADCTGKFDALLANMVARDIAEGLVTSESAIREALDHGVKRAIEVAVRLPHDDASWDAIDAIGGELRKAYWAHVHILFDSPNRASDERPVRLLLEVGNVQTAFNAVSYRPERVSDALAVEVLERALGDSQSLARQTDHAYWLPRLLDRAAANGTVSADRIATLALKVWLASDRYEATGLQWVTPLFQADPDLYARVMLRAHGVDVPTFSSVDLDQDAAASLIFCWRGPLFQDPPDPAALVTWALSVYAACKDAMSSGLVIARLADILAFQRSHDQVWPGEAARQLLDGTFAGWSAKDADELSRSLGVAKFNLRGVHSRAIGDGGRSELLLSEEFAVSAARLGSKWPRTSRMLKRLAKEYEDDARLQDAQTATLARHEGFERTGLIGIDVLVALTFAARRDEVVTDSEIEEVSRFLDIPVPETRVALRMLGEARLVTRGKLRINRVALRHFLLQDPTPLKLTGLPTIEGVGLPTANSLPDPMSALSETHEPCVMPLEAGPSRGRIVTPIHARAPFAAEKSPELHRLLATYDLLRLPNPDARAIAFARKRLSEIL